MVSFLWPCFPSASNDCLIWSSCPGCPGVSWSGLLKLSCTSLTLRPLAVQLSKVVRQQAARLECAEAEAAMTRSQLQQLRQEVAAQEQRHQEELQKVTTALAVLESNKNCLLAQRQPSPQVRPTAYAAACLCTIMLRPAAAELRYQHLPVDPAQSGLLWTKPWTLHKLHHCRQKGQVVARFWS